MTLHDSLNIERNDTTVTEDSQTDKGLIYWAAKPTNEIASDLATRVDQYYNYVMAFGYNAKWLKAFITY